MKQKKRVLNYPDFDLECDICGEHLKTPQGLQGHKRFKHPIIAIPDSIGAKQSPAVQHPDMSGRQSIKALREDVDRLKLQSEKRKLEAEFPSAEKKASDIMEQMGLGVLDNEVKAAVQRRLLGLGIQDSATKLGWFDNLLSHPNGVEVVINALRGILGINTNKNDNLASLLKEMGYSIKDLITAANAPKASQGLSIAGVDFSGANLTPELLQSVLSYKAEEQKAQAEYKGREMMVNQVAELITLIKPEIGNILRNRFSGIGSSVPNEEIEDHSLTNYVEVMNKHITCPKCEALVFVPEGLQVGDTVTCPKSSCNHYWILGGPEALEAS